MAPECAAVVAKYSPRVTRPASDMDELPVSQKPVKSRSQTADVPQTDEAKKLLLEMKSMLQGHLTHCQQGAVETPRDTDKTTVSGDIAQNSVENLVSKNCFRSVDL